LTDPATWNPGTSKLVIFGMAMFCPLAHIIMMKFMGHDHVETHLAGTHVHSEIE